jgi:S-ribosylhomocysteine lyase LuxS involved in autoinducer biosynthesis
MHGRLCQSGHTLNLTSIDVSGLKTGFYIIQVRTYRSSQVFKFLKRL